MAITPNVKTSIQALRTRLGLAKPEDKEQLAANLSRECAKVYAELTKQKVEPFVGALKADVLVGPLVHADPSLTAEEGNTYELDTGVPFRPQPLREAYLEFLV